MAYAALVSLAQVLDQILDYDQHSNIILGDKAKVRSLQKNIVSLVHFLDEFPEGAGTMLEGRISNAAIQAEDIIEFHISDEMHSDYRCWGVLYCIRQVLLSVFSAEGTRLEHLNWPKLCETLQDVMKEVETILEQVEQIKNTSEMKDPISSDLRASISGCSSSELAASIGKGKGKGTDAIGLEHDLIEIKGRLCGESSKLEIIPIIGMGGIGKTTLARNAYDDPLSAHHFDVRSWVTVSQDYSWEKILSGILSILEPTKKQNDNTRLLEDVYKSLKGRRYLIVMDDMWDTDAWDYVRRAFPDDSKGSRIIITSRHLHVASYVDPGISPHQMNLMDKVHSWDLMKQKVFAQGDCPQELEQIGLFIAEQCKGLPLAIVVISGILSNPAYQMRETWERVARNVNEAVNSGDDTFTETLSLSYKHLPHRLRPCFLYMGGFPEDYEIRVSKLVKLWAAEGFLKPNGSENLEEVAEEYLEDLTKRSLVLVSKRGPDRKIKAIKIHDLLRELALRKAQDEQFLQVISKSSLGRPDGILNSRRLSAFVPITGDFSDIDNSPIRTILLPVKGCPYHTLRCFKLLRTLDASSWSFASFPIDICELFHLRYLAISFVYKCELKVPRSLYKLGNLETLIILPSFPLLTLIGPSYLVSFEFWRLPRLRHLIMFNFCFPDPCGGSLTSTLKTLHTLASVNNFTCSKRILKMVPNLKTLKVIYPLDDLYETGWSKHSLENLIHFQFLEKFSLHVEIPDWDISSPMVGYVYRPNPWTLQKCDIAFPESLKKLTLSGCRVPWTDMTIIGSLPNLQVLKLRSDACCGDIWETTEGEFCQLQLLLIEQGLPHEWVLESSHFPRLRRLLLIDCCRHNGIPDDIGDIDTLELILLDACCESINESAKRIEENQRDNGYEDLHVSIVHRKRDYLPPRIGRVSPGVHVAQFIGGALLCVLLCCS